jgi:hypothetical protein
MVDRASWRVTLAAIESVLVGRAIFPDTKPLPLQHSHAGLFHEDDRKSAPGIEDVTLMTRMQPTRARAAIESASVMKDIPQSHAQTPARYQPDCRRSIFYK